jgi:hypothetical protein
MEKVNGSRNQGEYYKEKQMFKLIKKICKGSMVLCVCLVSSVNAMIGGVTVGQWLTTWINKNPDQDLPEGGGLGNHYVTKRERLVGGGDNDSTTNHHLKVIVRDREAAQQHLRDLIRWGGTQLTAVPQRATAGLVGRQWVVLDHGSGTIPEGDGTVNVKGGSRGREPVLQGFNFEVDPTRTRIIHIYPNLKQ